MADKRVPRELGTTGLQYTSSHIIDDERAKDIRWPKSIETFDKMKSDPLVAGSITMIKQYIRKVEWDIEPFGGVDAEEADIKRAELIKDALFFRMERSFDQVITDILTFIEYGFSFHEPTYKLHRGNIIWKDFPQRSAKTITGFKMNDKGRLISIEQTIPKGLTVRGSSLTTVNIPSERLLHFRTDSERNNPLGRSILKNAYHAWVKKSQIEYFEAIGIERDLNGLPLMKVPMQYFAADPLEDPEEYAILQEFIKICHNARNNEQAGIILPSDVDELGKDMFSFELVASKGTRQIDASKVVERYDYRIAQSMLSDFILMGSSSSGSFALSDNKIGSFVQSLEAYLEIIAEQFNRRAFVKLYELNGWDTDRMCKLVHKPIGQDSLTALGQFLNNAKNYITPDKTLEDVIRKRADLPARDEANRYIDVPTATHQAQSQRMAMEASVQRSGGNLDQVEEEPSEMETELLKALTGVYTGDS